ncbi:5-oxoprolinase/urea amidolyase family protein [Enterobacteriaceae bacterium 4M9]|nr:5-oxoprolinase/urea amidolyase family protein [Enterobacteriaceae bacterium 4M9]
MRFLPVNTRSVMVELPDLEQTLALLAALQAEPLAGIEELIPAARTLLVHFCPYTTSAPELALAIAHRELTAAALQSGPEIIVPVRYCGEDLPEVAEHLGLSVAETIRRHTEHVWQVAFTGFAPGFAYMVSQAGIHVPRRSTPRTRIPPGAVALAGEFSGIYPRESPGGWQLIGETPLKMWDLQRETPALLTPGARVRFVDEARQSTCVSVALKPDALCEEEPVQAPAMTVIAPGLLTLFQDDGRAGQAALGVSPSGAMDSAALHRANRIVGNAPASACLEITCGGLRARVHQQLVVAVTGAPCLLEICNANGQRISAESEQPVALEPGDEISLRAGQHGVRSYLALRGGFVTKPVLGSSAFDTLAQLGPAPLKAGDKLYAAANPAQAVQPGEKSAPWLPGEGDVVTLDVVPGPRTDWFDAQALTLLASQPWRVTPQSNRIGLRLSGEQPLVRSLSAELPSEGTCTGAIQVPASGQPVLFLKDRPLTGGYPVIGAVADYHLDLAGQIPPGAVIRFRILAPFGEITC